MRFRESKNGSKSTHVYMLLCAAVWSGMKLQCLAQMNSTQSKLQVLRFYGLFFLDKIESINGTWETRNTDVFHYYKRHEGSYCRRKDVWVICMQSCHFCSSAKCHLEPPQSLLSNESRDFVYISLSTSLDSFSTFEPFVSDLTQKWYWKCHGVVGSTTWEKTLPKAHEKKSFCFSILEVSNNTS
jgi:hypothetical protein